jgi:hypothetical protein
VVPTPEQTAAAVERRLARPGTKKGRTQRLVLRYLLNDASVPTNGRFVFYDLEQRGDAVKPHPDDPRKHQRRSVGWPPGAQDITDALLQLRVLHIVPWNWIVDETRSLAAWAYAATVDDYMHDRLGEARVNPWDTPPPLILCESRATAGVLERLTSEYVCPVTGTAGQVAGFLYTDVAPLFADAPNRPVLYLGDLDKSGLDIEANTRRILEAEAGVELDWKRLAMTEDIADTEDIEPIVKKDGRTGSWHDAVEVEALGQGRLVALVRDALDGRLSEPLDDVLERERRERDAYARRMNGRHA